MIILLMVISLIALLWATNHIVAGVSGIAAHYRLHPLFAGFSLLALATATPEIILAITNVFEGSNNIAFGDAIGINIANISLIFGLSVLLKPNTKQSCSLHKKYPLIFLVMLFVYSLITNGYINNIDGYLFLLLCLIVVIYFTLINRTLYPQKQLTIAFQNALLSKHPLSLHLFNFLLAIIVLPISTKYFIHSIIEVGHILSVNNTTLYLTIIAIGTTLPEFITSLIALIKGAEDLAIGNLLGANLFKLLSLITFPSMMHSMVINTRVLFWRDMVIMLAGIFILLWVNYHIKIKMLRWQGSILVLIYLCYMVSLLIDIML